MIHPKNSDSFNRKIATLEIFNAICTRNSSNNAISPIDSIWEKAGRLARELFY